MIELVEPFPRYGLERAWMWIQKFRPTFADDYFAPDYDAFIEHWNRKERSGQRSWGVMRDGLLGGVITSERQSPTVADFHCLFSPDFWGRDTVVDALGQACNIIFQDPNIDKLSTYAFARNMSIAGMMRYFGVTREGLLHGHTRQNGKLVDLQILGLQRSRFYVVWSQQSTRRVGDDGQQQQRTGESTLQPVDLVNEHVDRDIERLDDQYRDDQGRHDGNDKSESNPRPAADDAAASVAHQTIRQ